MKKIIKIVVVTFCVIQHSAQANDQERIAFIQQHFDQQSRHSSLWQNGWLGVVSVNAALNAGSYHHSENREQRVDSGTALAVGTLGITSAVQKPFQIHHYANQLSALPENTQQEISSKRKQAETWLTEAVERESYEQSRSNRLTSAAVHALAGMVIATEGTGEKQAAVSFISGVLFSELKIRTAPRKSLKALTDYKLGLLSSTPDLNKPHWDFQFNGRLIAASLHF